MMLDINLITKPNLQFQAFYLFFVITMIQLGVGIMGAPRILFLESAHDAWVSILIAYIYILLILTVMILILKQYKNADILGIQVDIFGKWFGKLLGVIYLLYFFITLLSVLVTYIEVVKVYIFPELEDYILGLLLLILISYALHGGIRVIIGTCFIFLISTFWILLLLIQPIANIDATHFQPVLQASVTELFSGAKSASYTLGGFEILFFIYPFIKNKKNTKKIAYLATGYSIFMLLLFTFVSIGLYSADQISRREWVVLDLFKIQTFTFIERFDYIVVASWMMVVVPGMMLLMWAITYGTKRLFHIQQKITLYIVSLLLFIVTFFFTGHFEIQQLIDLSSQSGLWIAYVYPLILLPIVLLKKRWQKKKGSEKNAKA